MIFDDQHNLCPYCRENSKRKESKKCFSCMCNKSSYHLSVINSKRRYREKLKKKDAITKRV